MMKPFAFIGKNHMATRQYRQGDLLFVEVTVIPSSARKTGHAIIEEGEATGHKHQVLDGSAHLFEDGNVKFLEILESATIVHEEHAPLRLPQGLFQVIKQREYEPEGPRYVRD